MKFILILAAALLVITGCATPLGSSELRTKRDGDVVSGTAGPSWTDEKLKTDELGVICEGLDEVVVDIAIARSDYGGAKFTATCGKKA